MTIICSLGIITSISLIGFSSYKIINSEKKQADYLKLWEQKLMDRADMDTSKNSDIDKSSEVAELIKKSKELICIIDFQRLGKRVPVVIGTSERKLDEAAGWNEETSIPGENGNSQIFGHRDTTFRLLKDIEIGDKLIIETKQGICEFIVYDTQIVMPQDIKPAGDNSKSTVQLITCYPFHYIGKAPKRYIVYAKLK